MTPPHLRVRACTSLWRCAVCPRDAAAAFVVAGARLPWLVVLCAGCARGFSRVLDAGVDCCELTGRET